MLVFVNAYIFGAQDLVIGYYLLILRICILFFYL
jgi:hypothetical protein